MSNYTKLTDFASKDTLPSGNASKIVKGTEIDDELAAIETAIATKANTDSPALTGTPTAPTAASGTNTTQIATTSFVTSVEDSLTETINTTVSTGITEAAPSGAVMAFAMSTAPNGWLKCNGDLIDRTTYANLFAAIGTTYGEGDGSTTFQLPDLRGEFIRGWDDGRGIDSGRSIGSAQTDQMQQITGSFEILNRGGASSTSEIIKTESGAFVDGGEVNYGEGWQGENGSRGKLMEFDSAQSPDARTGDETRPRNVALNYCIKY